MKNKTKIAIAFAAIAAGIVIMLTGCASHPPSKFEQSMFDIKTNYVPIVLVQTNIVPITVLKTNIIEVPITASVKEFVTNIVPVFEYKTNTVTVTNLSESYVFTPGAGAAEVKRTATEVGGIFGVGGVTGTLVGAFFSLWGFLRSRKSSLTAVNIAQTVETLREFIKALPNGTVYDNELVNWMQKNQANAGVLQNVLSLLERNVSNPDAKEAARNVHTIIEGLKIGTVPVPPTGPQNPVA